MRADLLIFDLKVS